MLIPIPATSVGSSCSDSTDFAQGAPPDQAAHRGLVRCFLRGALRPEKRVPWRMLPEDFPNWRTCYKYFRQWNEQPDPAEGSILEQVLKEIGWRGPTKQWSKEQTSFCIVDSQSVKNTDSAENKGYDAGKKVSGIKRHIAVDTQGLPHAIHVTTANVGDRAGALAMFALRQGDLSGVQQVLVDGGYSGKPFAVAVQGLLGPRWKWLNAMNYILSWRFPKDGWRSVLSLGLEKCRRLWKNCEGKLNTSLQMVVLAFVALLLKRL